MKDSPHSVQAPLVIEAPAKLNLFLNIVGRRADGYHLLDSLFVFCGLHDQITIHAADTIDLGPTTGPFAGAVGNDDGNLVLRAARLLQAEADVRRGARLFLNKMIPVAAGLGGGSADAAAVLRGLNVFWELHWPPERLEALASKLGADIPACVRSRPVVARGVGDVLSAAPAIPECGLLLVNPLLPTSTPEVFKAYARMNPVVAAKRVETLPAAFPDLSSLVAAVAPRGNDLLAAAVAVQPAIADVLAALRRTPEVQHVGLSGSGATCFALFQGVDEARAAGDVLRGRKPGWWQWAER